MTDPATFPIIERLLYGAIGTIAGFLLNEFRTIWLRRRKHTAYWTTIRVEIEYNREQAQMYLDDNVRAPLYRLSTKAFDKCYGELLADAALTEAGSTALMKFFAEVETFNRGLERAGAASNHDDDKAINMESGRLRLRAKGLIASGDLYVAAIATVQPHTKKFRT